MKVVKSTRNHKLWYQFAQFVEFPYNSTGISEYSRWVKHFESRYGTSTCYEPQEHLGGITIPTFNPMWREERNAKQKRLRVYIKQEKDLSWAQLNLA
jgi:hypothetical protein